MHTDANTEPHDEDVDTLEENATRNANTEPHDEDVDTDAVQSAKDCNRNSQDKDRSSKAKNRHILMTNLESTGAIENARELGYQLEWDQSRQK